MVIVIPIIRISLSVSLQAQSDADKVILLLLPEVMNVMCNFGSHNNNYVPIYP